jgi:hypothetical protein
MLRAHQLMIWLRRMRENGKVNSAKMQNTGVYSHWPMVKISDRNISAM